jgi:hypothetical protein
MKYLKLMILTAALIFAAVFYSKTVAPTVRGAGNVTVSVWGFYEPIMKIYYVWGEVSNGVGTPVTNLTITVNCYDASNTFVTSIQTEVAPLGSSSYGNPFVLLAGKKAPFGPDMIYSSNGSQSIDHCSGTVSFYECASLPVGLQITMDQVVLGVNAHMNGTIENIGTSKADWYYVYATGYDSKGAVIGTNIYQGATLDVNAVGKFSIDSLNEQETEAVVNYTITAQSFIENETTFSIVPQYIVTSDITGAVPEFPSVFTTPILLASIAAILIICKKRTPISRRQKSARSRSKALL